MLPVISLVAHDDLQRLQQGLALVREVFHEHVAGLLDAEGVERFLSHTRFDSLEKRCKEGHFVLLAEKQEAVVGFMEIKPPCHVAMLFIASSAQRQGLGRRLLCKACTHCRHSGGRVLTVNASPNAVEAYLRLGFYATEPERCQHGIKHTPMSLEIHAKSLLCEQK